MYNIGFFVFFCHVENSTYGNMVIKKRKPARSDLFFQSGDFRGSVLKKQTRFSEKWLISQSIYWSRSRRHRQGTVIHIHDIKEALRFFDGDTQQPQLFDQARNPGRKMCGWLGS